MRIGVQRERGGSWVDAVLVGLTVLVFGSLVLLESFNVRSENRILLEEDRCVRKNLRALDRALEFFERLNPQAKAGTISELMELVDLFAEETADTGTLEGCWIEIEGQGRGEVIFPKLDENGRPESYEKVIVRMEDGSELEHKKEGLKFAFVCLGGGEYGLDAETGQPRCTVPGHTLGVR